MKKLVMITMVTVTTVAAKAQMPKLENKLKQVYRRELDSLASVYKVDNACGLIKTFNDNGIVPARESITILYKDKYGHIAQKFLYTRDVH